MNHPCNLRQTVSRQYEGVSVLQKHTVGVGVKQAGLVQILLNLLKRFHAEGRVPIHGAEAAAIVGAAHRHL